MLSISYALPLLLALTLPIHGLVFKSEIIEANFDDRPSRPAALTANAVGQYGRLQWSGFQVDAPHSYEEDAEGVQVKSAPNYAGGHIDSLAAPPSISAVYDGSQVAFFNLERFWWGCSTADPDTLQQVPGWCTLEVYGFAHDVKEPVAKAVSFYFPKDDAMSMPMIESRLPTTFNAVSRVEFRVTADRPVLYLDNVRYKIYNVTSIGSGLNEVINSGANSQSAFRMQVDNFAGPA